MRLLTIISGVMLVLTGLFCFANSGETFLALAFVLGLVMIISSAIQLISYWWGRKDRSDNNGWIFAEAMITFILGILVQTSLIAADAAIPMVFGLWVMFSGVLRFVVATMINPSKKTSNFIWTMVIGIAGIVVGIYAFVNPMTANVPIAILLGIIFFIQGIGILELGIHMPHEKKVDKPKAKMIKIQIRKPMTKSQKKAALAAAAAAQAVPAGEEIELGSEVVKTDEITLDDLRETADDVQEAEAAESVTEEQAGEEAAEQAEQPAEEPVAEILTADLPEVSTEEIQPEEIRLDDIINALTIGHIEEPAAEQAEEPAEEFYEIGTEAEIAEVIEESEETALEEAEETGAEETAEEDADPESIAEEAEETADVEITEAEGETEAAEESEEDTEE